MRFQSGKGQVYRLWLWVIIFHKNILKTHFNLNHKDGKMSAKIFHLSFLVALVEELEHV